MHNFLNIIKPLVDERVKQAEKELSYASLERIVSSQARKANSLSAALINPGPSIIAEFKRASPSLGEIAPELSATDVCLDYVKNGASALSILTEPHYFKGDMSYLKDVRAVLPQIPILMKDFIAHEYQVLQAYSAGADVILLIVAMLDLKKAESLCKLASDLGLETLIEVHDEDELNIALGLGGTVIGVNNRNLKTLEIDIEVSRKLSMKISKDYLSISESGISSSENLQDLMAHGYQGFLVGTHLMKSGCPGDSLANLLRAK